MVYSTPFQIKIHNNTTKSTKPCSRRLLQAILSQQDHHVKRHFWHLVGIMANYDKQINNSTKVILDARGNPHHDGYLCCICCSFKFSIFQLLFWLDMLLSAKTHGGAFLQICMDLVGFGTYHLTTFHFLIRRKEICVCLLLQFPCCLHVPYFDVLKAQPPFQVQFIHQMQGEIIIVNGHLCCILFV